MRGWEVAQAGGCKGERYKAGGYISRRVKREEGERAQGWEAQR